VSSPNEPGSSRSSDGPGGTNGSGSTGGGHVNGGAPDYSDIPPWQRTPRRPAPRTGDAPPGDVSRGAASAGHSPGVDARVNRFISGGGPAGASTPARESRESAPPRDSAPPREAAPREGAPTREAAPARDGEAGPPARQPDVRPETYASELPDLSGTRGQRKPGGERATQEPATRSERPSRTTVASRQQGPVRASMQIRRLDPWSVLKVSLVLSVALFFVWMIAVAFLYLVLGGMGVWSKLNSNVGDLLTSASGQAGGELVSSGTIFGGAALIGLVNIVLLTAMATVGVFIYNLTTDLVGGIEVTLADRD
jgi:hypothetical protein